MKHLTVIMLNILVVAVGVAGIGQAAANDLRHDFGLNPRAIAGAQEHVNLQVLDGRVTETGTFQTGDPLSTVLSWYAGSLKPEPGYGQGKHGQCVILRSANSFIAVHRSVLVTVCPTAQGTQVTFSRSYSVRP